MVVDALEQLPADGELVIVDQSSRSLRARLRARLPRDARIHLISSDVRELPHARNLALSAGQGEFVVFFDDDVRLGQGVLEALLEALAVPGVVGAGPRIRERRVRPNAPPVVNEVDPWGRVRTNLDGEGALDLATLKGCAMAFRRERLVASGGFDRRYGGTAFLEDADASMRVRSLGERLRFVGHVAIDHLSAPSGGVRADETLHQWWRFHNTALFLRTHRGRREERRCRGVFALIAARFAWRWRRPSAVRELLEAWDRGAAVSATPPALLSPLPTNGSRSRRCDVSR